MPPAKFKLLVRRLPAALTKDEFLHQIQPLDDSAVVWYRRPGAQAALSTFSRGYIAFDDWSKAIEFGARFNNYVFVDKAGGSSTAMVELAAHQDVPTHFPANSAPFDKHLGSVEKKEGYAIFLNEYTKMQEKQIINFDQLLRDVEEKEKALKSGTVKETPLTTYMVQQTLEKEKKKSARIEVQRKRRAQRPELQEKPTIKAEHLLKRDGAKDKKKMLKNGIEKGKETQPPPPPTTKATTTNQQTSEKQEREKKKAAARAERAERAEVQQKRRAQRPDRQLYRPPGEANKKWIVKYSKMLKVRARTLSCHAIGCLWASTAVADSAAAAVAASATAVAAAAAAAQR